MRRTLFSMLAAVLVVGCADMPSAPQLTPSEASFAFGFDHPPPPFAIVHGEVSTEYGAFSFVGHFFTNKPGNIAWLQFKSTTTADVSFSANARIMSVNGDVSGVGTISINGETVQLNEIDTFTYQTYRTNRSISFSGGDVLEGFANGPRGIDIGDGEGACTIACVDTGIGGKK